MQWPLRERERRSIFVGDSFRDGELSRRASQGLVMSVTGPFHYGLHVVCLSFDVSAS